MRSSFLVSRFAPVPWGDTLILSFDIGPETEEQVFLIHSCTMTSGRWTPVSLLCCLISHILSNLLCSQKA